MKRVKWFIAAMAMGTLFFGCKAKEQTAEAPPPEQPKAEAPIAAKPETPAPVPAQPEAASGTPAPAAAPKSGYDRALLRAAMLKEKAPETFRVKFTTIRGDFIVTVNRTCAPIGADRFYNLANDNSYANTTFSPLTPESIVQFAI